MRSKGRVLQYLLGMSAIFASAVVLSAADAVPDGSVPASKPSTTGSANESAEVRELRQQLADQQRQIEELRQILLGQKKADDIASTPGATPAAGQAPIQPVGDRKAIGEIASLTPILPLAAAPAPSPSPFPFPRPQAPAPAKPSGSAANPCEATPEGQTPAFIRLGSTCLIPIGFMDLTAVWRDKNAGSSMGSNFGSIPFNNTVNGNLSEFRIVPQNSRIGFRFDGDWKGTHFIGYNEFDFNGTSGSSALAASNGAFVPRLRLFWVDVRKGKIEFLGGQSWSMMTPNRKGLSALPGDLFYTQVVDINYVAGLTWTRQPGMRFLYHPSDKVTWGFSAENPDQYAGGSAGGSTITYPTAFASYANAQLDIAQGSAAGLNILNQPTVTPDFISKLAFDPSSRLHIEVGGVERNFKVVNPTLLSQHFSKSGGGVIFGVNGEVVKNFRLITTNYWSDGGGRYLFGQAPDLVVRSNGSLSLVHSGGTIDGFEARVHPKWLLYGYYSGIYIGRNTGFDANGTTRIGYGYQGAPNSQNRAIQEVTFGFNETIWSNPRYGAVNAMGQYEWLNRSPWYVAAGQPKNTHDNTIYFNLRYTLPGGMPNF
jgi:hypothetical protein